MAQLKHPNPNFTINSVKGWNTRLLYTYYGNVDYVLDLTAYNFGQNIFASIDTFESTNNIIASKGRYKTELNDRFFKTGKSILIKGFFIVSSNNNAVFNMWAGIENISAGTTTQMALTNNKNDHNFFNNGIADDVPVFFEIVYTTVEQSNNELLFQANGFYHYEINNYNSAGPNLEKVYVPITQLDPGKPYYLSGSSTLYGRYGLSIIFQNSTVSKLVLNSMTVEELT